MGKYNYAYEKDNRLKSLDKKVPGFNSENNIKKSNDVQESSLNHSSICFVTKPYAETPYCVLPEKCNTYENCDNSYERLQVTQATIESQFQNDSRALSCEKRNSMHETTEIEPNTKYRTNQIKGYFSRIKVYLKCTYLVFSVLVATIAITSAVMVLMILFGGISVQKCSECKLLEPNGEKQNLIDTTNYLKSTLQQLIVDFNSTSMKNDKLCQEIAEYKVEILSLTNQIKEQRDQVSSNISSITKDVHWLKDLLYQTNRSISNLTLREGIQGPQGYNGSEGPKGKSADFKSCKHFAFKTSSPLTIVKNKLKDNMIDGVIVGAFCTSNLMSQIQFYFENEAPICECTFLPNQGSYNECTIHLWYCK